MKQKLPQHIAIVMDGNGRWAENRGLERIEGHKAGIKAVKEAVRCCLKKEIRILSLFAFSSENWSRPESEVDFLMQLFIQALENEIMELHENGVRLQFIGSREQLSLTLQQQIAKAESLTVENTRLILNVAVNYSGKWDIMEAAKNFARQVLEGKMAISSLSEATFSSFLNTHGLCDPDLFIRTSGEQRISNFFLWQLAYTELYFSKLPWPDFDDVELEHALDEYMGRERRFGLTSKQIKNNLSKDNV
ncbi:polyprenyl diphosphate synthase [Legionella adelaidensis]|uniref:polyprenyl diphosphate synthase n=1 Tax=Legionella adelaidensis TaxID=45056 RepID=UPI0007300CB8|nr:polyprenyl diphosphate synthase [Legionella adelaidensis]